jgi:hypothetical protein
MAAIDTAHAILNIAVLERVLIETLVLRPIYLLDETKSHKFITYR